MIRHRTQILAAAVAVLVSASPAMAQSWEVLAEEGYAAATVANGDYQFGVECMEIGYPSISFSTGDPVRATRRPVDAVIRFRERTFTLPARAAPDVARYDLILDMVDRVDMIGMMDLLASENSVAVSIPSLNLSATFSLAGSADAISAVMARCEER